MIKIYKVNTFEKFQYLLNTLHERGVKWMSGDTLDNEVLTKIFWDFASCNGLCVYRYGNKVTISDVEDIDEALKFYGYKGEEYIIIEDVKLPKPKEKPKASEAQQAQPHQPNVIQPGHYNQGDMDLFETWYLTYPFNEFRAIMKSHIAKYLHRYQDKNGTEDLDKASYCIQRLREYEEREANGN